MRNSRVDSLLWKSSQPRAINLFASHYTVFAFFWFSTGAVLLTKMGYVPQCSRLRFLGVAAVCHQLLATLATLAKPLDCALSGWLQG